MSHRTGPAPLPGGRPRRLVTCSPGCTGIVIGHEPTAVADVRRWITRATRTTPRRSQDVALVASELATNAIRHSRSGDPGGRVLVEMFHQGDYYLLCVTDDGPRPGDEDQYPRVKNTPTEVPGGLGLHMVDALSRGWSWLVNTDGTVTVQARIPCGIER
ncbi:ATP-binding protein (plasmid) [Nocardiopsis exhalans]|uniref:ATP-binding protein n=1 Tax=Nocardiopsis exhalans TaxID=163604 RepID=A0ABY5DIB7_9ACTN|nr:ATP-binding protein [Nocardiopsis exhalans]USY23586.1 ATP-binding protein [Nocardiopsis exhalans]